MWGCNERMGRNGHPFIRLSGPLVFTVTVTPDCLVNVGGGRTSPCWNLCSEGNDVFKEYETNSLFSKGQVQIDDYFCLQIPQALIL